MVQIHKEFTGSQVKKLIDGSGKCEMQHFSPILCGLKYGRDVVSQENL